MAANYLSIRKRILWDKQNSLLVTSGCDILIEVESRPESGYGFLVAGHPSDESRTIRWYVDHITGRSVNPNATNQIVVSGSYLHLFPDFKNPRPEDWVIYLSPVNVEADEWEQQ